MRKGLRAIPIVVVIVLSATSVHSARFDGKGGETPVHLTLEIDWSLPSLPELPNSSRTSPPAASPVDLEISQGRILEAVPWPHSDVEVCEERPGGTLRLGTAHAGRVRVRVEAPVSANLVVRTGAYAVPFAISALLDAPQRTPPPVEIGMARLPWDALEVSLPEGDGTAAPGAVVPVSVGFNVLTAEPCEVVLHCLAELRPVRGGEPLAQVARDQVVPTNTARAPSIRINLETPRVEGTYVLEVRASWEPVAPREGSRISRFMRRRRLPAPSAAVRRSTLVVLGPKAAPVAPAARVPNAVVDALDLGRIRGHRLVATGRAPADGPWCVPEDVLAEAARHDLLRGLIGRGNDLALLPPGDANGRPWMALGLKVAHPGRPHRLTVHLPAGPSAELGVALVVPDGEQTRRRILLDARAEAGGTAASVSWPIWPDASEPFLVLTNRGAAAVRIGGVELVELGSDPPPAVATEAPTEAARVFGLHLGGPHALDRFGGAVEGAPDDALALARNLAAYLLHCGGTLAVLPDDLADRSRRQGLEGQSDEDSIGPDRLEVVLRVFEARGLSVLRELNGDGPLPGLPAPGSAAAQARGLVRIDERGLPDGSAYHPLHPEVARAWSKRVAEAIAPRRVHASLAGLLVRLGPGASLLGGPETGLDDGTYGRFVAEALTAEEARKAPGLASNDPNRFAARRQYVAGPGKRPWLSWRSVGVGRLYAELARATHEAASGAMLAVVTPGPGDGPAGREARRADLAGLRPEEAWRAVGMDLESWPAPGPGGPIVLRGVDFSDGGLARDLATHPGLDNPVAQRPLRGLLLSGPERVIEDEDRLVLTAPPVTVGPAGEEPLGHALAVLDAQWVLLAAAAVAGREERTARFARVLRALPSDAKPAPVRLDSGVAVRTWEAGGKTYVGLANDTPYTIRLDSVLVAPAAAAVNDLGRGLLLEPEAVAGGKRVVLNLAPFDVAAVRVSATDVRVERVTPYPLDDLKAQYQAVSLRLGRLAQGGSSESEQRVQRILVRAMQAYRERQFAEFARLAGSRWVRALDREPLRTGDASSDLSPRPRLR
jgi:hypothetical protein